MNCPRCVHEGGASPYRGVAPQGAAPALVAEAHAAGVTVARCRSCRGAFVTNEDLRTIENRAPGDRHPRIAAGAVRRAYDPPTATIRCPSCHGDTTRREWSIGTMVFVDVCVECRGVWLDGGELEVLSS